MPIDETKVGIDPKTVDIPNRQLVGVRGNTIVVMNTNNSMTKEAALVHAAYLVALADESENFETFREILERVSEAK